jgi:hypothetical protein
MSDVSPSWNAHYLLFETNQSFIHLCCSVQIATEVSSSIYPIIISRKETSKVEEEATGSILKNEAGVDRPLVETAARRIGTVS